MDEQNEGKGLIKIFHKYQNKTQSVFHHFSYWYKIEKQFVIVLEKLCD